MALTLPQLEAIAALLECRTQKDAAEKVGVSERTMCKWVADPEFDKELTRAQGVFLRHALRRLNVISNDAIHVFAEEMKDAITSKDRQNAADKVLSHLLKLKEAVDIEGRIADLQARVDTLNPMKDTDANLGAAGQDDAATSEPE